MAPNHIGGPFTHCEYISCSWHYAGAGDTAEKNTELGDTEIKGLAMVCKTMKNYNIVTT